jgi:predicted ester cyclase
LQTLPEDRFSKDVVWHVSAPIEGLHGREAVAQRFFRPLFAAFEGLHRRDLLFIGGLNRRDVGGTWCAAVTHYVGNFTSPLFGIRPSGHLAFLRAGEFYRLEDDRITEARIILDLPDLMRQCGHHPFPVSYGSEMTFPVPATQDGLLPKSEGGELSLDVVEAMLGDLHAFDPATFGSARQTGAGGCWHDDMMWYGPAGIGSNFRWDGFVRDHRESFLKAFPDRKGGNHYCRIGDGAYAAVSGWPSMTMTWQGDYLGQRADGRGLTLRVMDFYRCESGKIMENWVLLDYVDLLAQMGVDVIARDNRGSAE